MDYDKIISAKIYNHNKLTTQGFNFQPDISKSDSSSVDYFFQQDSPNKYPPLIICEDSKQINQSTDYYQKYMDVITDDCGNRFNIRNINSSAGVLQAGYAANIDLDSHLKNINYYADKCYYDNHKIAPNSTQLAECNGLKRNANILLQDYSPVGRHYKECSGTSNSSTSGICWNSPPTDFNLSSPDIRQRYNFGKSYNKFQTENCLRESERELFPRGEAPPLESLNRAPGHNGRREAQLLDNINRGTQHDYYKFFESNQCVVYPNQRLFNNITKRSMLPNAHFRNSEPVYRD